jgi:hypothetical protein
MDITFNTPALLFPALSLVLLAYTNRFLALANVVRTLHNQYEKKENKVLIHGQIKNLRYRPKLVKNMQALGAVSCMFCIVCMYMVYIHHYLLAHIFFAIAMILFAISLLISLIEINLSNKAIELQLSNMEGLEDPSVIEYLKNKF